MFFTKLIFCDLIEKSLLFETAIKMRSEKKKVTSHFQAGLFHLG